MAKFKVERALITLPPGASIGETFCKTNPRECCPPNSGTGTAGGVTRVCACSACAYGAPSKWIVDLTGFADGECACSDFNHVSAVLEHDADCTWIYDDGTVTATLINDSINEAWFLLIDRAGCSGPVVYLHDGPAFVCEDSGNRFTFIGPTDLCGSYPDSLLVYPGDTALTGSCDAGITVACCPNQISGTLAATITSVSGCACLDGLTYPLLWQPANQRWASGQVQACGGSLHTSLQCLAGGRVRWNLGARMYGCGGSNLNCIHFNSEPAEAVVCDPFYARFRATWNESVACTAAQKCCTGTMDLEVTEA